MSNRKRNITISASTLAVMVAVASDVGATALVQTPTSQAYGEQRENAVPAIGKDGNRLTATRLAQLAASAANIGIGDNVPLHGSVRVVLHDENLDIRTEVYVARDGSVTPGAAAELTKLFRCRRSHLEKAIHPGTLAMLADLGARYPGRTIGFVSAYRGHKEESKTSPHRAARAIDFRIEGIDLLEIRDYLWRTYQDVGIGYYPSQRFIHMDTRPGQRDTAWTFERGVNLYNPAWAARVRDRAKAPLRRVPGQAVATAKVVTDEHQGHDHGDE